MPEIKTIPIPFAKRLFDIVFSLFIIILLLPLIIIIIIAIKLEQITQRQAKAPIFYREKRVSQGREFDFMKFMIFKPEVIEKLKQAGKFIHTKPLEHDGKSLSKVGSILIKVYLDELPQIFLILKGDMSFVGPRPQNTEEYQKVIDSGFYAKQVLKAGLTGDFQSHKGEKGYNQNAMDEQYMQLTLNQGQLTIVWHDIRVLARTLLILIRAQGI